MGIMTKTTVTYISYLGAILAMFAMVATHQEIYASDKLLYVENKNNVHVMIKTDEGTLKVKADSETENETKLKKENKADTYHRTKVYTQISPRPVKNYGDSEVSTESNGAIVIKAEGDSEELKKLYEKFIEFLKSLGFDIKVTAEAKN